MQIERMAHMFDMKTQIALLSGQYWNAKTQMEETCCTHVASKKCA